jgi:lipoate-protein ligase A
MKKFEVKRLLNDEEYENPQWAMAVEEAILRTVAQGSAPDTLRFWRNKWAIIIGRFQCPKVEIIFDSCLKYKITVVRRFTGGGTVYQDGGNLNFSIFIHTDSGINALPNIFNDVGTAVIMSLRDLGVPAELDGMSIYVKGKKLCGMAGTVMRGAILAHGCLLVDSDLETLYYLLNFNQERERGKFTPSSLRRVTTIRNELDKRIAISEVERILAKSFEKVFQWTFAPEKLMLDELELAHKLYENKYSKLQWALASCRECPEKEKDTLTLKELMLIKN